MWRTWRCTGVINWPYPRLQTCPGVSWRVLTCSDVSRHVFLRIEIQQTEMAYMKRRCEYSALNLVGVYRISFTLKVSHFFFSQWHRLSLRTNGIYVEFPTTEVEIINYFEILAKLASLFFNKFLKRKKNGFSGHLMAIEIDEESKYTWTILSHRLLNRLSFQPSNQVEPLKKR